MDKISSNVEKILGTTTINFVNDDHLGQYESFFGFDKDMFSLLQDGIWNLDDFKSLYEAPISIFSYGQVSERTPIFTAGQKRFAAIDESVQLIGGRFVTASEDTKLETPFPFLLNKIKEKFGVSADYKSVTEFDFPLNYYLVNKQSGKTLIFYNVFFTKITSEYDINGTVRYFVVEFFCSHSNPVDYEFERKKVTIPKEVNNVNEVGTKSDLKKGENSSSTSVNTEILETPATSINTQSSTDIETLLNGNHYFPATSSGNVDSVYKLIKGYGNNVLCVPDVDFEAKDESGNFIISGLVPVNVGNMPFISKNYLLLPDKNPSTGYTLNFKRVDGLIYANLFVPGTKTNSEVAVLVSSKLNELSDAAARSNNLLPYTTGTYYDSQPYAFTPVALTF